MSEDERLYERFERFKVNLACKVYDAGLVPNFSDDAAWSEFLKEEAKPVEMPADFGDPAVKAGDADE